MSETASQDRERERATAAARAALASQLGLRPAALRPASGGVSNYVFLVEADGQALVVRLGPAAERLAAFARERRVVTRVREAGVPAPEILAVGEQDGFAYTIGRRIAGTIARDHPERLRTLSELGALAAERIHAIRTEGFGRDDSFGEGPVAGSWRDWLEGELQAEARLELLKSAALVTQEQEAELRRCLAVVAGWTAPPILNHGDLRLKNVLVDEAGAIVGLIDWEDSISAPGPHWDLSIALHDLWVDQIEAFLKGYGMAEGEVKAAAPAWRLFNALNYAPEVERALEASDSETLARIRTRFSGALDLFGAG